MKLNELLKEDTSSVIKKYGLNLVVAVPRDSLCVVADCCMSYTMCKVERFVLTVIKRRLRAIPAREWLDVRRIR